ncbi:Fc.00g040050.m01.CDS01 [Cosmosporella sp. VM-42]
MVRLGFILGDSLNPDTAPRLDLELIDLEREDNLSESYLTLVNSKGQVPALTCFEFPSTLDDSCDIATWLCEKQPELLPKEYQEIISGLVDRIYSFHITPLVVNPTSKTYGIPNRAAARLESNDISEQHRRALEIKSVLYDSTHGKSLDPDNVARAEKLAREVLQELVEVLKEHNHGETWIFGHRPTILDAHATPLIARLMDVGRYDLLPDEAQDYARRVITTSEWKETIKGRSTF